MEQQQDLVNKSEQLSQQLQACEKMLSDCPISKFSDLRFELKQVKEKLRFLNQSNRLSN